MKIDRRYFRVTSGLLADRAAQIHKERAAARVEIDPFVIEIGSTGYYCSGFSGALKMLGGQNTGTGFLAIESAKPDVVPSRPPVRN